MLSVLRLDSAEARRPIEKPRQPLPLLLLSSVVDDRRWKTSNLSTGIPAGPGKSLSLYSGGTSANAKPDCAHRMASSRGASPLASQSRDTMLENDEKCKVDNKAFPILKLARLVRASNVRPIPVFKCTPYVVIEHSVLSTSFRNALVPALVAGQTAPPEQVGVWADFTSYISPPL
ncbi:hypothetical protein KC357_g83 [Hortaea werneckii]|nr:hypothetical protein KC357_g83 [Hortaea werneckii]